MPEGARCAGQATWGWLCCMHRHAHPMFWGSCQRCASAVPQPSRLRTLLRARCESGHSRILFHPPADIRSPLPAGAHAAVGATFTSWAARGWQKVGQAQTSHTSHSVHTAVHGSPERLLWSRLQGLMGLKAFTLIPSRGGEADSQVPKASCPPPGPPFPGQLSEARAAVACRASADWSSVGAAV